MELQRNCFRNQKESISFTSPHFHLRNTRDQKEARVRHRIVGFLHQVNKVLVWLEKIRTIKQQKKDCEARHSYFWSPKGSRGRPGNIRNLTKSRPILADRGN